MTKGTASLQGFVYSALFAALIIVLGFISIPIGPVPISGISLGVMLAASVLPPKRAAYSVLIVILLGAAGLPVFSGFAGGMGILLGPRGGYYAGFLVGAYIISFCIGSSNNWARLLTANIIGGMLVVYAIAIPWLIFVTHLEVGQAFFAGALPFLPGDLLKALVTTVLARTLRRNIPGAVRRDG